MSIILTQSAARVRKQGPPSYSDQQEASMALTEHGALLTQQAMPPLTEIVRLGNSWYGKGTTATATVAQTLPTVAGDATLFNGEAAGGKSYVVEGVGFWAAASEGAAQILTIFAEPSIVALAALPATTDTPVIRNLQFRGQTYGGHAGISATVTVTDNGWLPIFTMNTAALTANKGMGAYIPLNGMFVIAPGFYLALCSSGVGTTMTIGYYFVWHEVQLNLV